MGWHNPPIPWSEFERTLSDRQRPGRPRRSIADGGDSPAWSPQAASVPARRGPRARRPGRSCRTPNCTRTPASASSTAPPRPRSCSRRRTGSACTASPSPTTTASTASCAWPRRPRATPSSRPCSAPSSRSGSASRRTGVADPEGSHLLVLARREEGYHRLADRDHRRPARAAARRGAPCTTSTQLAEHAGRRLGGAHRMPQGRGAAGARRRGGADAARRELDRLVALFGRDNVVVELFDHGHPLDQRAQRRARRARRSAPGCPSSRRTPCTTRPRPSTGSPPRSPPCGHGAASTSSTAGCPPPTARTCAAAPRWRAASPATPARSPARSTLADELGVPAAQRQARGCRSRRCPAGTRP